MAKDAEGRSPSVEAAVALVSNLSPKTKNELSASAREMLKGVQAKMVPKTTGIDFVSSGYAEPAILMEKGVSIAKGQQLSPTKVVTQTPTITKEDAISLIDGIKYGIVQPKERDIRDTFWLHSIYYIILIAVGIGVNVNPTAATAIGAFGLGSLAVGANFNNLQSAVDNYINDRRNLLDSLIPLELMEGPNKDFPGGVQPAFDAAQKVLTALASPSPPSSPS